MEKAEAGYDILHNGHENIWIKREGRPQKVTEAAALAVLHYEAGVFARNDGSKDGYDPGKKMSRESVNTYR